MINLNSKTYEDFRWAMGKSESSNNYQSKNTLGFLGRYQFGLARLTDFGLCKRVSPGYGNNSFVWADGYSERMFLTNEPLQDEIFDKHIDDLIKRVQKEFSSIIGTVQRNTYITLSGLVAGCHLGGMGGVKNFIYYGINSKDAYGGSVKNYIVSFAGYDLMNKGRNNK